MSTKLTNDDIDKLLIGRQIRRIGNYKTYKEKIKWKCLIDGMEWDQSPCWIFHKTRMSGCPKCANNSKLTNDVIDAKLINTKIIRIGNYINNCTKIEFLCTSHNEKIYVSWANLQIKIKNGFGCKKCKEEKVCLSNAIIDERIKGRNFKRVGNYINANTDIEWETNDGYKWFATPSNILSKTNFNKKRQLFSNEKIDKKLSKKGIIRIGNYIDRHTKIEFQCNKNSSHKWNATPYNVTYRTGCPHCKKSYGENFIKNLLDELDIKYDPHALIRYNKNKKFYVDFLIKDLNLIIEYNGIQHYKAIKFFGGKERFKTQSKRDNNLRNYCNINNIRLLELPYNLKNDEIVNIIKSEVSN